MLQQGTLCFEDWQNFARFWLSNHNNQSQDSAIRTGVAREIASTDIGQNENKRPCPNRFSDSPMTLEEVSQREKELILIRAAEENDLNSLKKLESMGTNIEAKKGIYRRVASINACYKFKNVFFFKRLHKHQKSPSYYLQNPEVLELRTLQ